MIVAFSVLFVIVVGCVAAIWSLVGRAERLQSALATQGHAATAEIARLQGELTVAGHEVARLHDDSVMANAAVKAAVAKAQAVEASLEDYKTYMHGVDVARENDRKRDAAARIEREARVAAAQQRAGAAVRQACIDVGLNADAYGPSLNVARCGKLYDVIHIAAIALNVDHRMRSAQDIVDLLVEEMVP